MTTTRVQDTGRIDAGQHGGLEVPTRDRADSQAALISFGARPCQFTGTTHENLLLIALRH